MHLLRNKYALVRRVESGVVCSDAMQTWFVPVVLDFHEFFVRLVKRMSGQCRAMLAELFTVHCAVGGLCTIALPDGLAVTAQEAHRLFFQCSSKRVNSPLSVKA